MIGRSIKSDRIRSPRLWRPLLGIVVAYAIAAQSLLITLGGFTLASQVDQTAPTVVLCHHVDEGTAPAPGGKSGHAGCTLCVFCFASAHVAVIGTQPILLRRVSVETLDTLPAADGQRLPGIPRHSIAEPRGPPLHA
jgi:Protein of unknown function (DUF2946)